MTVEWRRKLGGRQAVHVFVDGKPLCRHAEKSYGIFATTGWEPAELATNGRPYGLVCTVCERAAGRL